jgi:hypothetical protein
LLVIDEGGEGSGRAAARYCALLGELVAHLVEGKHHVEFAVEALDDRRRRVRRREQAGPGNGVDCP